MNNVRILQGLESFCVGMVPYVTAELQRLYGEKWRERARSSLPDFWQKSSDELNLDVSALMAIIRDPHHKAFAQLRTFRERNLLNEVREARNKLAHMEYFSNGATDRALSSIELLLETIKSPEVLKVSQLRQSTGTVTAGVITAKLAPSHVIPPQSTPAHVVSPRPRLDAARVPTSGTLAPGQSGIDRGVCLLRYLAGRANQGDAFGVSYSSFIAFLHCKSTFAEVKGRNYAPADNRQVIEIAHQVTQAAGRVQVSRGGISLSAGMDTFIWPQQKPHERSVNAWNQNGITPPYSRETWQRVFPDNKRQLLTDRQLDTIRVK